MGPIGKLSLGHEVGRGQRLSRLPLEWSTSPGNDIVVDQSVGQATQGQPAPLAR